MARISVAAAVEPSRIVGGAPTAAIVDVPVRAIAFLVGAKVRRGAAPPGRLGGAAVIEEDVAERVAAIRRDDSSVVHLVVDVSGNGAIVAGTAMQ